MRIIGSISTLNPTGRCRTLCLLYRYLYTLCVFYIDWFLSCDENQNPQTLYVCVCVYACMYFVCVYLYVRVYVYVCIYICVCMYVYIYICIYYINSIYITLSGLKPHRHPRPQSQNFTGAVFFHSNLQMHIVYISHLSPSTTAVQKHVALEIFSHRLHTITSTHSNYHVKSPFTLYKNITITQSLPKQQWSRRTSK